MASNKSAKGNPASHRMSNANLKARRQRSWKNGEERKVERRAEQQANAKRNDLTRRMGELTPWEKAGAIRKHRRSLASA